MSNKLEATFHGAPALTFNEEKHRYDLDGKRVTSVTTILSGGIPKPQLVGWAARTVAQAAIDNPGATYEELAEAHTKARDAAGVRGTTVHTIAENLLAGDAVEIADDVWPYVKGLIAFLKEWQIAPLYQECIVASRTWKYAGKFDLIGTSPHLNNGEPFLLDWKTSKNVYGDTALQVAAYATAEFMVYPVTGLEAPLPEVTATYVAHIQPGETKIHPLATSRTEILTHQEWFLDALRVYRGNTPRKNALKTQLTHPNQEAA